MYKGLNLPDRVLGVGKEVWHVDFLDRVRDHLSLGGFVRLGPLVQPPQLHIVSVVHSILQSPEGNLVFLNISFMWKGYDEFFYN